MFDKPQQIWKTQQWPQDWKRSVCIPIPKKGNAKECSNYHTIALISQIEAEAPILWPPDVKNWLIWKDPVAGKDWRKEKGTTEDEMDGWHHWLDGHEFEQDLGVGDGQGSLVCCSPWGCKELDMTKQLNWTLHGVFCFLDQLISSWGVKSDPIRYFFLRTSTYGSVETETENMP